MDNEDEDNMTPLSWAIQSRSVPTVRALLLSDRNPVNPNSSGTKKPALHFAIELGSEQMVEALLAINTVNPNYSHPGIDSPPLVCAVRLQNERIFDKLLQSKRVDADRTDGQGRSALWWAAALDLHSYAEKLLDSSTCNFPNKADERGDTPLSIAVQRGNSLAARKLMKTIMPGATLSGRAVLIAAKLSHVDVLEDTLPLWADSREYAEKVLKATDLQTSDYIKHCPEWQHLQEKGRAIKDEEEAITGEELSYASRPLSERFRIFKFGSRVPNR